MNKYLILLVIGALTFFGTSCKKDEDETAKPVITFEELGYNNSAIAYVGNDLHMEAELEAAAGINKVEVEIHPEFSGNWEFDTVFTEFSGLKNTTFHKHVEIPATADTGTYHFHFKLTDMDGNQVEYEADLHLQMAADTTAPLISVSQAPSQNQVFGNGDTLRISGNITDDIAVAGVYIGLVRQDQNLADADVNDANTITLLHEHGMTPGAPYTFNASIVVGAAQDNNITPKDLTTGNWWQQSMYYFVVKSKDSSGNWAFSAHYLVDLQ